LFPPPAFLLSLPSAYFCPDFFCVRREAGGNNERERVGFNWDASVALESGVEDDDEGREVSRDERFLRSK
jgi:hypothetical protein